MKKVKMTEVDYLEQYLTECKELGKDIFVGEIMKSFLELKKKQFCIKSYKKTLKFRSRVVENDESDFFQDL
jgi:hypothetical protein